MSLDGSDQNRATSRARSALIWISIISASLCFALGATSASAAGVSLDTPLGGVDVNVDEGGVDVGVSVPATGTDVEANVGVDDGGVSVDAGVNSTPASEPASGSSGSQPASGSGGGRGQQDGSSSKNSEPASSPKGSAAVNNPRTAGQSGGQRAGDQRSAGSGSRSPQPAASLSEAATRGGLIGLVEASGRTSPTPAAESSGDASVVAQLVEYIPTWLWFVLAALLAALVATAGFAAHQYRRRRAAFGMAMQDPLTEVANVKAFDDRLAQEFARARRHHSGLGVLMIDLDRFKEVNDNRGHAVGDRVLVATATALKRHTRESDLVARVGGDEFAVICPETGVKGLNKLRDHLEDDLPMEIGFGVGLSIGAATMRTTDEQPSEMVRRADSKMYECKSGHREAVESDSALAHL